MGDKHWSCHTLGQSQFMIMIYIMFVELESSMVHAKFLDPPTSSSEEKIIKCVDRILA